MGGIRPADRNEYGAPPDENPVALEAPLRGGFGHRITFNPTGVTWCCMMAMPRFAASVNAPR